MSVQISCLKAWLPISPANGSVCRASGCNQITGHLQHAYCHTMHLAALVVFVLTPALKFLFLLVVCCAQVKCAHVKATKS